MAPAQFEWDASEEKTRERRIAERRERVQERLRQQQQQCDKLAGSAAPPPPADLQLGKGKAAAAASTEVVRRAHMAATAEAEGVRQAPEARTDEHHEACDAEEAALREQVAAEAEASQRENRAIDLEWERLQGVAAPQQLAASIEVATAHCQRVLASKEGVLASVRALLARRDDQYVRLLRAQGEETDALIAGMHTAHARCKAAQEAELEAVEGAYLQERTELVAAQKVELDALLERRSALEQEFLQQYLAACEQCEDELERLKAEGVREHAALKRRLEGEVASLEAHLDSVKASFGLNADKLDYNYRVLVEREKESAEALMQQRRKIMRQWEVLNRLKKRYAAADARCATNNARVSDEYQAVTRAFNHLESKFRHFKAADLARFDKVRAMKEGELEELLGNLLEAEHLIASFVAGLPPTASSTSASTSSASASGSCTGEVESSAGLGLEVVGTAVAVDPLAAAAAAVAFGAGEAPAEVVSVPAGEAGEAGRLIPAYRPSGQDADGGGQSRLTDGPDARPSSAAGMDALAWEELSASADSGALSLLLADGSAQGAKLRQLVAQVPTTADGRLTAAAAARSLGLRHGATVATLALLFAGSACLELGTSGAASELAQTIQPREPEAAGGDTSGSSSSNAADAHVPEAAFSQAQVENGLGRLLQLLAPGGSSVAREQPPAKAAGRQRGTAVAPAAATPQPTSKQYWQARADAALPASVARSWQLLERQAGQQFATLQARVGTADEVLALRQENERLKATLAELLSSPLNKELQLPPTLLLR